MEEQKEKRLLRIKEVTHKIGLSRSKIYDLMNIGEFPVPIKFGERVSLWPESEVDAWIENIIKKSERK